MLRVLHVEVFAHVGILQLLPLQAQRGEPRVLSLAIVVGDEVHDDGGGDDVPDVFGVIVLEGLERNPDALSLGVERGTAAVPRVDCGVDLQTEEFAASVGIRCHLDSAHHALRDRDGDAADGVADDGDRRLQAGQLTKLHGRDASEKLVVFHAQQREVALDADGEHLRHVLLILAAFLELHLGVMLDTVRVCQHAVAGDDEPGRRGCHLAFPLPRKRVVGLRVRAKHLDHRVHLWLVTHHVRTHVIHDVHSKIVAPETSESGLGRTGKCRHGPERLASLALLPARAIPRPSQSPGRRSGRLLFLLLLLLLLLLGRLLCLNLLILLCLPGILLGWFFLLLRGCSDFALALPSLLRTRRRLRLGQLRSTSWAFRHERQRRALGDVLGLWGTTPRSFLLLTGACEGKEG